MMRSIKTIDKPIAANINIPGSKSITNRALLLAALADGVSNITQILLSDDTFALIEALGQLGILIELDASNQRCVVHGCAGRFPKNEAALWCADAGTVARFLLAAAASSPGKFTFDGSDHLRTRPIEMLIKTLERQGAKFFPKNVQRMPFVIEGREGLLGGKIEIDGSESSQFLSAILMVAPFAESPMTIKTRQLVSASFVDMTTTMMGEFGVMVRRLTQERFSIPTPQRYAARNYVIEPDLTTASYFFAAAAVTAGHVTIQPIEIKSSKQGDIKFVAILEKMGCRIQENAQGFSVQGPAELRGVSVDMRDCSDTFMTLAAVAPFAKTPTAITNIGHTRLQESNRISVMCRELQKINVHAEEGPDWIRIHPSVPKAGIIDAHGDHRIAMSFSIIGLRVPGIQISGAECVSKTCPEFFTLWDLL